MTLHHINNKIIHYITILQFFNIDYDHTNNAMCIITYVFTVMIWLALKSQ